MPNLKIEIERDDGSIFIFPFDPRFIMKAKEWTYRERSTGAIIENPDFLASYSCDTLPEDIEKYKKYGFKNFVKGEEI